MEKEMNFNYFTGKELGHFAGMDGGLYLVGTCVFNPTKEEEKYYWIKVGQASKFNQRMRTYKTHNPMLWKGDFFFCQDQRKRDSLENLCFTILETEAIGSLSISSEWFEVSKETYLKICNEGFNFFKTHPFLEKMNLKDYYDKMWEEEKNWATWDEETIDK